MRDSSPGFRSASSGLQPYSYSRAAFQKCSTSPKSALGSVVKYYSDSVPPSLSKLADAMAKNDAIIAARTLMGTAVDCEHDNVALTQWHHRCATLHSRSLLSQHKLAALKILARLRQERCRL